VESPAIAQLNAMTPEMLLLLQLVVVEEVMIDVQMIK